jgi:hypothetical protein
MSALVFIGCLAILSLAIYCYVPRMYLTNVPVLISDMTCAYLFVELRQRLLGSFLCRHCDVGGEVDADEQ